MVVIIGIKASLVQLNLSTGTDLGNRHDRISKQNPKPSQADLFLPNIVIDKFCARFEQEHKNADTGTSVW